MLYIFSDGYADQFGGEEGKRFKSGRFKKLLLSIHRENIQKQKAILTSTHQAWKSYPDPLNPGSTETGQIDDILVIGIRIE